MSGLVQERPDVVDRLKVDGAGRRSHTPIHLLASVVTEPVGLPEEVLENLRIRSWIRRGGDDLTTEEVLGRTKPVEARLGAPERRDSTGDTSETKGLLGEEFVKLVLSRVYCGGLSDLPATT